MSVTGLLGFGLTIPSLTEAADYYTTFGLEAHERSSSLAMRCVGRDQDQITLVEGPQKQLAFMSFSYRADGLDRLKQELAERGIGECDPLPGVVGDGFWFRDPDGVLVNLQMREPAAPRERPPTAMNLPGRYDRVDDGRWEHLWEERADVIRPRRMGHTILFSPDIDASERFYREVLGFRFSDRNPGRVTFLNTGSGDHHVFGFAASTHSGLHHTSFEVADMDEIAIGAQRMVDQGHTTGWGLGRHTMGSNLFHYVRDPWGSWTEYFSDIDQITDDWVGRDWDVPPAIWCPTIPENFVDNLEPTDG
jgi:catechol 2,3-dioxygenase-like lactoylglutathione lyase family enzyme